VISHSSPDDGLEFGPFRDPPSSVSVYVGIGGSYTYIVDFFFNGSAYGFIYGFIV